MTGGKASYSIAGLTEVICALVNARRSRRQHSSPARDFCIPVSGLGANPSAGMASQRQCLVPQSATPGSSGNNSSSAETSVSQLMVF